MDTAVSFCKVINVMRKMTDIYSHYIAVSKSAYGLGKQAEQTM